MYIVLCFFTKLFTKSWACCSETKDIPWVHFTLRVGHNFISKPQCSIHLNSLNFFQPYSKTDWILLFLSYFKWISLFNPAPAVIIKKLRWLKHLVRYLRIKWKFRLNYVLVFQKRRHGAYNGLNENSIRQEIFVDAEIVLSASPMGA